MSTEEYSIGYEEGHQAGWNAAMDEKPAQRTWVGLTWSDVPDQWLGNVAFMEGGKWAEKTLKEKNT